MHIDLTANCYCIIRLPFYHIYPILPLPFLPSLLAIKVIKSISEELQELIIQISLKLAPRCFLLPALPIRLGHDYLNITNTRFTLALLVLLTLGYVVRVVAHLRLLLPYFQALLGRAHSFAGFWSA